MVIILCRLKFTILLYQFSEILHFYLYENVINMYFYHIQKYLYESKIQTVRQPK